MSQSNYDFSDTTLIYGDDLRVKTEEAVSAILTINAGATAPTTTFAYMLWIDTSISPNILKQRNAGNTAWMEIAQIGESWGLQSGAMFYAKSLSGTNTLAGTMSPAPSAYTTGMVVLADIINNNTGSATINLNTLGAKTIKKFVNGTLVTLEAGDLQANQIAVLLYDGTDFQLLNPSNSRQATETSVSVTSGDATLTADEELADIIIATGTPGTGRNVIVSTVKRVYVVYNNLGDASTLTFKTSGGTGIVVAQGKHAILRCDGTNVVRVTADI